jgi:hypothetical protein
MDKVDREGFDNLMRNMEFKEKMFREFVHDHFNSLEERVSALEEQTKKKKK